MTVFQFATSSKGIPIWAHRLGQGQKSLLVLGGVHGDEPEGVIAAHHILASLLENSRQVQADWSVVAVPEFNIDGILRKTRQNANGVDLNRNLPTRKWQPMSPNGVRYFPGVSAASEPETQALVSWLSIHKPRLILSYHSYDPLIFPNGEKSLPYAKILAKHSGYKIVDDMGYPVEGDLGTFAENENGIPTLTFEVERGLAFEKIKSVVLTGFQETLQFLQTKSAQ